LVAPRGMWQPRVPPRSSRECARVYGTIIFRMRNIAAAAAAAAHLVGESHRQPVPINGDILHVVPALDANLRCDLMPYFEGIFRGATRLLFSSHIIAIHLIPPLCNHMVYPPQSKLRYEQGVVKGMCIYRGKQCERRGESSSL